MGRVAGKVLVGLLTCLPCLAQEAAIFKIADADAVYGRRLYERFKIAEAEYENWKRNVELRSACGSKLRFSRDFASAIPEGENACLAGEEARAMRDSGAAGRTETFNTNGSGLFSDEGPLKGEACREESTWNHTVLGRTDETVAYWECENGAWVIRNDSK